MDTDGVLAAARPFRSLLCVSLSFCADVRSADDVITFEGLINHCSFERLDGNAVMVSGYNRNTTIADNEFSWLGASAAAGWGYTNENDGMDGQQPRFTKLIRNYCREIGIIEKQSSFWFQAKTAQTIVSDNVLFNGPRAASVKSTPHIEAVLMDTDGVLRRSRCCSKALSLSIVCVSLSFCADVRSADDVITFEGHQSK